jgi:hypothetical protein
MILLVSNAIQDPRVNSYVNTGNLADGKKTGRYYNYVQFRGNSRK